MAPKKKFIHQNIDDKVVDGRIVRAPVEVTLMFVPLRVLFKTIFSCPRLFQMAHTYMHEQHSDNDVYDIIYTSF